MAAGVAWHDDSGSLQIRAPETSRWPAKDAGVVEQRAHRMPALRLPVVSLVALSWLALAGAGLVWTWHGSNPKYFPSPDESVNRLAAQRVADTGWPVLNAGADDPEDLRHPRHWITIADGAVPSYPPAAYALDGALVRVPVVGAAGVAALAAVGIAAFAAGVAVLGERRRGVALLAPLVAFPATYWLMRPWMNMATFLALGSIAFLFWAIWKRGRSMPVLVASTLFAGGAAAVRPDLSGVVMLAGLGFTLAEADGKRESWSAVGSWVAAGALAVALILILNWYSTGDPLQTGYQIVDARAVATPRMSLPFPLGELQYIFLPNGLPDPLLVMRQAARYWFLMGPVAILSVTAAVAAAATLRHRPRRVLLLVATVAVVVCFAAARVTEAGFGASAGTPELRHSLTRYWAPIYLFVAVLPLAAVMRASQRAHWMPMLAALLVLSAAGGYEVLARQPESMTALRDLQERGATQAAAIGAIVPSDAVVYTTNQDKVLWSHREIATLPAPFDPERAATSIARALAAEQSVYVVQPGLPPSDGAALQSALRDRGWDLAPTGVVGVYRAVALEEIATAIYDAPFSVQWLGVQAPTAAVAGRAFTLTASVRNSGATAWSALGDSPVHASYHWSIGDCGRAREYVIWDGVRTALPGDVPRGGTAARLAMRVQSPPDPGTYCLIVDMVREKVGWFGSRGAEVYPVKVVVTPETESR
jgi:hypothetical protein